MGKTEIKYAAIVTYTTGEKTGATVKAKDLKDAWGKLLDMFSWKIRSAELVEIVTPERAR